jgi:hypothetical protein
MFSRGCDSSPSWRFFDDAMAMEFGQHAILNPNQAGFCQSWKSLTTRGDFHDAHFACKVALIVKTCFWRRKHAALFALLPFEVIP